MAEEKKTLAIVVFKSDHDFFTDIQAEYRKQGISASNVFHQFVQAYKKDKGIE